MANTIWKFEALVSDSFELEMPEGAKIIALQLQNNRPTMWAIVNQVNEAMRYCFNVYGTGHPMKETWRVPSTLGEYVGTVQLQNGLVFHWFLMDIRPLL